MQKFLLFLSILPFSISAERIVVIGGGVAELVCVLGRCDEIVARDVTSAYPEKLNTLPNLGYFRNVQAEAILAQKPDLVIASGEANPVAILALERSGIRTILAEEPESRKAAFDRLITLGKDISREKEAAQLLKQWQAEYKELDAQVKKTRSKTASAPGLLFLYARGPRLLLVAGSNTVAHTMITEIGYRNAASAIDGFKPFTAESALASAPGVILIPASGAESFRNGTTDVFALPGIANTPAARDKRITQVDELTFLNFSPRSPAALRQLHQELSGR